MVEGEVSVCKRLMGTNKGGEKMRSSRCMGVKVWNEKFPLKSLLTLMTDWIQWDYTACVDDRMHP